MKLRGLEPNCLIEREFNVAKLSGTGPAKYHICSIPRFPGSEGSQQSNMAIARPASDCACVLSETQT